MIHATLSSNYQLSFPKTAHEQLGLEPGQQFVVIARGRVIELVPTQSLQQARGMLAGLSNAPMDYRDRSERLVP
jgi:bifunctional DNA-binding transcriptional regulator/antitoxin component of YhaV-PrlF toxin-antitoxin module